MTGVVPVTLTDAGLKAQLSPEGRPEQERVTVPLNPLVPVRLSERLPIWPLVTETLGADEAMVKSAVPAGAATVMEPKRPPCSLLIPAAK